MLPEDKKRPQEIPANPDSYGTSWFLRYHDKDLLESSETENSINPDIRSRIPSCDESVRLATLADTIFDIFKNPNDNRVSISNFLQALTAVGIRRHDPRLREMMIKLKKLQRDLGANFDATDVLQLNPAQFKEVLRNTLVIREWPSFCKEIERLFANCRLKASNGEMASYIPQLARSDPDHWAVSVCTIDGQRFSSGDANEPFCLEAAAFPLNYAIALNDLGDEVVNKFVGQEPSGHNYNALVLDANRMPHNPMINAGAMVICSLFKIFKYYKKFAGGEYVGFSNQTYLSERDTADRNFALGHFMREQKCFPDGVKLADILDLYFQTCSVEVNCDSGAVIAASLANGGVCPITGERIISSNCVRDVLSLMYSCGMNNYSGQFAFRVGIPAKSGVSGCVLLVVPDVMGICVYSPPVDQNGNSTRGVQFANELVKSCNFHTYDKMRSSTSERKYDPRRPDIETKAQQIVILLFAAANGDVTAMRRLLLQGMNLGLADYEGRTAMHIAAGEGHTNCVRFLMSKARVDHMPIDKWGRTPIDDAMRHGHDEIIQLIMDWDRKLHHQPTSDRSVKFYMDESRRESMIDTKEFSDGD